LSLLSYGIFALGVLLGGIVLLVIFSLLAMAQKGDECLDQLEFKMLQRQDGGPPLIKEGKSENIHVPASSDLNHRGAIQTRSLINR
jgi:hypothetical protein